MGLATERVAVGENGAVVRSFFSFRGRSGSEYGSGYYVGGGRKCGDFFNLGIDKIEIVWYNMIRKFF